MSDFFAYDEDVSDASEEESKESEHSEGKFYVMFAGFSEGLEEMLVKQRVYLLADDLDFVNDYTEEFHESKVRRLMAEERRHRFLELAFADQHDGSAPAGGQTTRTQ